MSSGAVHGGDFIDAVGHDLRHIERLRDLVSADVLDAWFDPAPGVLTRLREFLPDLLRTSPPVEADGLEHAIAEARGLKPDYVLAGAGSSDLIFRLLPLLIKRREAALLTDPVYGEYPHVLTQLIGARVERCVLSADDDFKVESDAMLDAVRRHTPALVVVVNPNSPTGVLWPREDVLRFLDGVPDRTDVLIDETYVDYAGREHSVEAEVERRPNLFVMKSMSKAYALSGTRVGYLAGSPDLVKRMRSEMPPWSVSFLSQVSAVEALADPAYYERRYDETRALRETLAEEIEGIPGLRVYHSDANFLLVECTDHLLANVLEGARAQGVYLRDCSSISPMLRSFFRVAVKNGEQNHRIATTLRRVLGFV